MPNIPESLILNSSVAAVVSNPRLPDNPLIACNEAFLRLSGYAREEVIGRNCRFMRGPGTEWEQTALLSAAIAEARPTLVELTNYRKDGAPFRNAVMIAPLFDDRGDLEYFLGSQMVVDAGNESRQAQALALIKQLSRRQRQILEGLTRGHLNKQIAYELSVTERTVKMHRAAMLRALNVRTVAEAIRTAIEAGF
ncbi:LuxR C-terminal-related transcriptional regulator [Sphingobium sp. DEHP117]|uniref:LuxR C-terminal-related transcriptional regulator n=1 Tax=Sphingobium sp. DEHP117 TaxID=2993436 RepID=UPI0027D6C6D6|nr:LuxR C-terminal-related transcriptional regulator [Sphingobium sp. DEHP117]MDQ4419344.1 LuxR C-terminal-related transcriptional regulator [Sphingobium sp. DEHP117]